MSRSRILATLSVGGLLQSSPATSTMITTTRTRTTARTTTIVTAIVTDRYYSNSRYGYNGYGGDPRRTFTCESKNSRRNYCNIPTRGHVEIYKQHSPSPCTYGRSWGVNGDRVWVEDGCRAEFAVF